MNIENQDIKSFFDDMRQEDLKNKIPDFEEVLPPKRKSTIRYLIPASIAACLLVGIGIGILNQKPEIQPEENTVVITLENKTTTETLLLDDPSVFSWESETDALINDFND